MDDPSRAVGADPVAHAGGAGLAARDQTAPVHRTLALAHWRRCVAELYGELRAGALGQGPAAACAEFRRRRDELFRTHIQSPLPGSSYRPLDYFDHDPAMRVAGRLEPDDGGEPIRVDLPEGPLLYHRIAHISFELHGAAHRLALYWLDGYGGGLFLPFRDHTCGRETYGGGRYLYDTIKGADLGAASGEVVLDFNYAYNPSCAYSDAWVCPLAPRENHLRSAIAAGERIPPRAR